MVQMNLIGDIVRQVSFKIVLHRRVLSQVLVTNHLLLERQDMQENLQTKLCTFHQLLLQLIAEMLVNAAT